MHTTEDAEFERFIHDEADRTGLTPAEVLQRLLAAPVPPRCGDGPVPAEERARRHAVIRDIQQRVAELPVLDDRPMDELLGYDEYGLPT